MGFPVKFFTSSVPVLEWLCNDRIALLVIINEWVLLCRIPNQKQGYTTVRQIFTILIIPGWASAAKLERPLRPFLTKERFLKPKKISEALFSTCFRMFYARRRTELGSIFSECLRSYGENYLDTFFFSPRASLERLAVLPFSEKKSRRCFIGKWGLFFEYITSKTDFEETGVCRRSFQMISWINGKRRWTPPPKMAGETSRKANPIRPFPGSNTPAKVLKPRCSAF